MGLKRARRIFLYSDSEPNEVLISMCHLVCLPLSICMEYEHPNYWLILVALFAGLYQLWAVLYSGKLKSRLNAVKLACLVALATLKSTAKAFAPALIDKLFHQHEWRAGSKPST